MIRSLPAAQAAAEVPLCPSCLLPEHEGLCFACAPSVLPQVKHPSWHRDAHSGRWLERETKNDAMPTDPDVARVKRRNERKRAKRQSAVERFTIAMRGGFTASRPAKVA